MESLSMFMKEMYITEADSRLTVKDIYNDFKEWVIKKHDITTWNKISRRQVYDALKNLPDYQYVRFKEGYCLKGLSYRRKYLTLKIIPQNIAPKLCPESIRKPGIIFPTIGHRSINK